MRLIKEGENCVTGITSQIISTFLCSLKFLSEWKNNVRMLAKMRHEI